MKNQIDALFGNVRALFVQSDEEKQVLQSIRELKSCSDSELLDLGISRFNIEEVVRGYNDQSTKLAS